MQQKEHYSIARELTDMFCDNGAYSANLYQVTTVYSQYITKTLNGRNVTIEYRVKFVNDDIIFTCTNLYTGKERTRKITSQEWNSESISKTDLFNDVINNLSNQVIGKNVINEHNIDKLALVMSIKNDKTGESYIFSKEVGYINFYTFKNNIIRKNEWPLSVKKVDINDAFYQDKDGNYILNDYYESFEFKEDSSDIIDTYNKINGKVNGKFVFNNGEYEMDIDNIYPYKEYSFDNTNYKWHFKHCKK